MKYYISNNKKLRNLTDLILKSVREKIAKDSKEAKPITIHNPMEERFAAICGYFEKMSKEVGDKVKKVESDVEKINEDVKKEHIEVDKEELINHVQKNSSKAPSCSLCCSIRNNC